MMQLNRIQDTISVCALAGASGNLLPSPAGRWHVEFGSVLLQVPLISSFHVAGKNTNNLSSSLRTSFLGERYEGKHIITTSILYNVYISRAKDQQALLRRGVLIVGNLMFRRCSESRKVVKAQLRNRHGHGVVSVLKVSLMLLRYARKGVKYASSCLKYW